MTELTITRAKTPPSLGVNYECTFHDLHWEKEISLKGYFLPESLSEALQILSRSRGKARVVAGGTDVIPQLRRKELEVDSLVDLSRIAGLDSIQTRGWHLRLGFDADPFPGLRLGAASGEGGIVGRRR